MKRLYKMELNTSYAMVLETQQWLNVTYGTDSRFKRVDEDGRTGWSTIYALIRPLQIELGISVTVDSFGAGTESRFIARCPNGITQQNSDDKTTDNVYAIIQGALWCKGYSTDGHITKKFYGGTGDAILQPKFDMGFEDGSTVDVVVMKALLSRR